MPKGYFIHSNAENIENIFVFNFYEYIYFNQKIVPDFKTN